MPQEYAKRPFRGFLERENWPCLGRVRVLQLKYLLRECEKSVKHMEAVVWEKNSMFMTVKSSSSRVGRLYAIWPLPWGGGGVDTRMTKKKWNSCRKPIWTCLPFYLSFWAGLHQDPASLRCIWLATKIEKNISFRNTKAKRLLPPSLKRNGLIFNHGLNKVANRFGILKFLLAYNNNKIISENVGKSYFQLNFVHWTLAPGSWLPIQCFLIVANRCLKMRAPLNVKDGGRLVVVVCNMWIELQQWQK